MTEFERLMLCICCGTSVGIVLGCWIVIIKDIINLIRKRFSKKNTQ